MKLNSLKISEGEFRQNSDVISYQEIKENVNELFLNNLSLKISDEKILEKTGLNC